MKLPDYTKSKKWVELRELMGAKDLVNFNAKIKKTAFSKPTRTFACPVVIFWFSINLITSSGKVNSLNVLAI